MTGTKKKTSFAVRVTAALKHKGISQTQAAAELSRRLGVKITQQGISHMARLGAKSALSADLAKLCGVEPEWLAYGIEPMVRERANGLGITHAATHIVDSNGLAIKSGVEDDAGFTDALEVLGKARGALRRLPIVGAASLGYDGFWVEMDFPVGHGDGYVEHFSTDRNAYALRVRGDSMFPAIRDGNIVVVEPNVTPNAGEFVMVRLKDGRSTVKEFLWRKDGAIALQAVNGQQRMTIPEDQIEKVHFVAAIIPGSKLRPY